MITILFAYIVSVAAAAIMPNPRIAQPAVPVDVVIVVTTASVQVANLTTLATPTITATISTTFLTTTTISSPSITVTPVAAAVAARCFPSLICVDALSCGQRYGGYAIIEAEKVLNTTTNTMSDVTIRITVMESSHYHSQYQHVKRMRHLTL